MVQSEPTFPTGIQSDKLGKFPTIWVVLCSRISDWILIGKHGAQTRPQIGAQHWLAVEAVDRMLCDIHGVGQLFGGLTMVLGSDFLQMLPVVPHSSQSDIVNAIVQCSHLYQENVLWQNLQDLSKFSSIYKDFTYFNPCTIHLVKYSSGFHQLR